MLSISQPIKGVSPGEYYLSLAKEDYYLEGGAQRRIELAEYLDEALANRGKRKSGPLLTTDPKAVEKKLIAFWKPKGISIRFEKQ